MSHTTHSPTEIAHEIAEVSEDLLILALSEHEGREPFDSCRELTTFLSGLLSEQEELAVLECFGSAGRLTLEVNLGADWPTLRGQLAFSALCAEVTRRFFGISIPFSRE